MLLPGREIQQTALNMGFTTFSESRDLVKISVTCAYVFSTVNDTVILITIN